MGYAGGNTKNPDYYTIGDHSETLQLDFNPALVSYEDLLHMFWSSHNPLGKPWIRQYMSAIFFHSDRQKQAAFLSMKSEEETRKSSIHTEIAPLRHFYLAEDYHQKYILRHQPDFMQEFRIIYPREADFIRSTAAARVNGYLAGYGTYDELLDEVGSYGLSPALSSKLLNTICAARQHEWSTTCRVG